MLNLILRSLLPFGDKLPDRLDIACDNHYEPYVRFAVRLLFGEDFPLSINGPRGTDLFRKHLSSSEELRIHLLSRPLRIKRIALIITTRCTLACPHCVHLNSHYSRREDFDRERILASLRHILDTAFVEAVSVMGGEAMLHPELPEIITSLNGMPNLNEVSLTTNGSLLPPSGLLEAFRLPKSRVFISNYDSIAPHSTRLVQILEENGINYDLAPPGNLWIDAGGTENRGRCLEELRWMYARCLFASCPALFNGFLYNCPRNANAVHQGLVPHESSGGFLVSRWSGARLKERIIDTIYVREEIPACNHCDFVVKGGERKKIPRGT